MFFILLFFVLIVPSGIETKNLFVQWMKFVWVLIVPSGIETLLNMSLSYVFSVLIVPSGIETSLSNFAPSVSTRINCT